MSHKKRIVTPREIWNLYLIMVTASFFWGAALSIGAFVFFHFNMQALVFLGGLTVSTALLSGLTSHSAFRRTLDRVRARSRDADLDLP